MFAALLLVLLLCVWLFHTVCEQCSSRALKDEKQEKKKTIARWAFCTCPDINIQISCENQARFWFALVWSSLISSGNFFKNIFLKRIFIYIFFLSLIRRCFSSYWCCWCRLCMSTKIFAERVFTRNAFTLHKAIYLHIDFFLNVPSPFVVLSLHVRFSQNSLSYSTSRWNKIFAHLDSDRHYLGVNYHVKKWINVHAQYLCAYGSF